MQIHFRKYVGSDIFMHCMTVFITEFTVYFSANLQRPFWGYSIQSVAYRIHFRITFLPHRIYLKVLVMFVLLSVASQGYW